MNSAVTWPAALRASIVLAAVAVLLAPLSARAEMTVTDAGGREVKIEDTSRIVSIGGDITEILYDLNQDGKIIAVDTTSQFPAEALEEKQEVGYMRALSAEGVLSTNPSVIIASAGSGPPEVVKLLKSSSVPYVEVVDDPSPEAIAEKVRFVAKVVDQEEAGEKLAKQVEDDFEALAKGREQVSKPMRAIFILSVQNGRAMVAGKGTGADAILQLAGAENAAGEMTGYKPVANEAAMELAPDAIVTMSNAGAETGLDRVRSVKGMDTTPAVKNGRVITMDGLYLLGFGPRAGQAARDLMNKLYPNLAQSNPDQSE
ncbi:ABC transporter substrate-binding protein [Methyloligella sp. 2.7D]|uniref:heme/hemin ABC transporter substrate-binding protein n=1 Tax=unclassified Methyloligella TaxID=2625955 RepID=UPI00157D259D|nr:ABC transporter substrate-binding protein [Methyloligella sp. GL2]QKP77291.1 ABC transporter substrate-binding protein [Methyloligella sp. GL2]